MAATTRWRVIGIRCGLLAFSSLAALVIAECVLRLMGVSYPLPYVPDKYTGSRLRPGWSGWFNKEGRAYVTINSAGFRDREHSLEKPANTCRILVLGDSYVEAVQLSQQETFWAILEQQLQMFARPLGKQVEVIAMGVSGWGTAQQFQALSHFGFAYHPDVVVLAFLAANDLRNNSRQLEGDNTRPYFLLDQDGLRLDESFLSDPLFLKAQSRSTAIKVALINNSCVLQLIQESREKRWRHTRTIQESGADAGLDDVCFVEPQSDSWKDAWTVTERLIQRMHDECQEHSAKFCVVTVTTAIQVHPVANQRLAYQQRLRVENLNYADERIRQLGLKSGFPVVILSEPLREYAEEHQEYLHGFANSQLGAGHWNPIGHRLAATALAQCIRTTVFVRTPVFDGAEATSNEQGTQGPSPTAAGPATEAK